MATLEAGSRYDNQVKSINTYIDAQLRTGLGLSVYYEDQDRVGALPADWVEIDLTFGGQRRPVNTAPGEKLEVYTEFVVNINCFREQAQYAASDTVYTLYTMVTNIKQLFEIGTVIPVYDYGTVGNPWAGRMTVEESPRVQELSNEDDEALKQVNISVTLMHHSVFSKE